MKVGYLADIAELLLDPGLRLEISCAACGTGGSNPSLSAIFFFYAKTLADKRNPFLLR